MTGQIKDEAMNTEGTRLYQGAGPNSYRVRIFLAEKGIDVPREEVDIFRGDQKAPEFKKLNSLGQIPVLTLGDGTVITESMAICRYFETLHPRPPLFGADPAECGKVEMWNRRAEIVVFGTIGNVAFHTQEMFANRQTQFPAFAETERLAVPAEMGVARPRDRRRPALSCRREFLGRRHHRRSRRLDRRFLRHGGAGLARQCPALARTGDGAPELERLTGGATTRPAHATIRAQTNPEQGERNS